MSVVLPEGFKAQVVAASRQAAVTYGGLDRRHSWWSSWRRSSRRPSLSDDEGEADAAPASWFGYPFAIPAASAEIGVVFWQYGDPESVGLG
jgi:hypothetical protein